MRINISLTDESGKRYEGTTMLVHVPNGKSPKAKFTRPAGGASDLNSSFDLNPRAFMKKFGHGKQGPQRFTLLVALLAKGNTAVEVRVEDIRSTWNSMKAILGGKFNSAYSNRAKDHGWVNASKRGVYVLAPAWTGALGTPDG